MNRSMIRVVLTVAALCMSALPVMAGGDPEDSGFGIHVDAEGVAAGGADVVAYLSLDPGAEAVVGVESHSAQWRGATWLFASEPNLVAFRADPERYAPQYGGYCAWAMARDDLATIDRDQWSVVDDKLYLNYNSRIQNDWKSEQDEFIQTADENWVRWETDLRAGG